ncbi:MAG: lysine exporter LysO family protein [Proteiniphilum sp.]|nr:lysine exporter LysO family protein [Proteiniphilum sp.]NCB25483.1 lysine exporter LysO family protein [Bacteroidia bacterium]MDD2937873.1 lysine exporter LysO family protein [Proteiniphilum sp.]MDD3076534.1 lysine exporter LysO family protein [Proteiniphilum sp.]MDD3779919.1 lysine exporter LysO family protein [Proteiniphilum sp.]
MKQSFVYLLLFVIGVTVALSGIVPEVLLNKNIATWVLYTLLFLVGIQIGAGKNLFTALKRFGWKVLMIPLATTVGTFAGVALLSLIIPGRSLTDCLSVGAGFAYYSLSSILITEFRGAELGTVALLANIMREFSVLILAPWMVKHFGKLGPISAGGATTMDTTLPVITKYAGPEFVVIALFHGMIIDFTVPLWVSLFLSL